MADRLFFKKGVVSKQGKKNRHVDFCKLCSAYFVCNLCRQLGSGVADRFGRSCASGVVCKFAQPASDMVFKAAGNENGPYRKLLEI